MQETKPWDTLSSMAPESVDAVIAGNVRAARARLRLTQQELADELGWSRPALGSLENGTRRITVADAASLCRALGIDLAELLRGAPTDLLDALGLR